MNATVEDLIRVAGLATLGEAPGAEAVEITLRTFAASLDGSDPLRREAARMGAILAEEKTDGVSSL